jgi:putative tryptophan/tyrosine transport system substrate-binding protein
MPTPPVIQRRAFVQGLALALLVAPLTAGAQPAEKVYRVGVLSTTARPTASMDAFRRGLRDRGYVEGRNLIIEHRGAGDTPERYPDLVAELVQINVDVIVAIGTPPALAAKRGTSTVPIVMISVADPVGSGLVQSLARPGGNVTGLSLAAPEVGVKHLELLKEAKPTISRVIHISDPTNPGQMRVRQDPGAQAAAKALGLTRQVIPVTTGGDLVAAFPAILKARADAITVSPLEYVTRGDIQKLVEFAIKHRLLSITNRPDYLDAGLLLLFSVDLYEQARYAATHVDKLLKGAKPADLPVEQPTKFNLIVNLKTARALGLALPQSLLLRADRVIE